MDRLVPWNEVEAVIWKRPAVARLDAPALFLANGDRLRIAPAAVDESTLSGGWADLPAVAPVRVPLEFLRGALLVPPRDERQRASLWRQLLASSAKTDRVLFRNGDEIAGELSGFDGQTWRLGPAENDNAPASLALAVLLSPDLLATPPVLKSRLLVRLAEGSQFTASEIRFTDEQLLCSTQLLGEVTLPLMAIAEIRPLDGRCLYLSDVASLDDRGTPWLTRAWPLGRDQSTTGMELIIGERGYSKGLGMHAPSEVSLTLDGGANNFAADVGLAPAGQGGGGATVEVVVDGKPVWSRALLPGETAPVAVPRVPLLNAKKLTLRVLNGPRANILDHVVWGNARINR